MRTVAAKIKLLNGSLVARPIQQRSHREELVEREFAVKNMAAGKSVSIFEVFRRDDLVAQDLLRQRRRVLRNCLHDCLAERCPLAFPIAVLQFIRRVLHVNGHHLLSRRSK